MISTFSNCFTRFNNKLWVSKCNRWRACFRNWARALRWGPPTYKSCWYRWSSHAN